MKEIDKNEYYRKFAQVSVNQMIMSTGAKCKCGKLQEFTVFLGEGQKLSTLFSCCCSKCLTIVIKEAIKDGIKTSEEQIKRDEDRLYKESLAFVRKAKLNKLEELK